MPDYIYKGYEMYTIIGFQKQKKTGDDWREVGSLMKILKLLSPINQFLFGVHVIFLYILFRSLHKFIHRRLNKVPPKVTNGSTAMKIPFKVDNVMNFCEIFPNSYIYVHSLNN